MDHSPIYLWPGQAPYTKECGDQAQPSITPYIVDGSKGAVVVCPGGGYHFKAPHEGGPIAEMINEARISAFVLDYRVSPCPCEAPLTDALRAIRVVRGMGYEKVAILGFSAGGNLACCAATLYASGDANAADPIERLSSRPDGLISCYSVVSMTQHTHAGSMLNLLGDHYGDVTLQRRFSAEWNVNAATPPAFIWHTASDGAVPVQNSLNLACAYAKFGVPFELHVFPEGRHGLGLAKELPAVAAWAPLCQQWLRDSGYVA